MRALIRLLFLVLLIAPALVPSPALSDTAVPGDTGGLDESLSAPGVATWIMIGRALLESGDAAGALPYYQRVWQSDRHNHEFVVRLADVAVLAQRQDVAINALRLAHEEDPEDLEVGLRLAGLWLSSGKVDDALQLSDDLYELAADNPDVLALRLDLQYGAGDFEGALQTLEELRRLEGDRADLRNRSGEMYARLNRMDEAEREWRAALELDSTDDEARSRLNELLRSQGRQEELVEELESRLGSGNASARDKAALADLYLADGRLENAAAVLLPMATSGDLDPAGAIQLVELLGDLGRQQEALDLLDKLEIPEGHVAGLDRIRGDLLLELGEFGPAEEALRKALAQDPQDNAGRLSLLLLLSQQHPELLGRNARVEGRSEFLELLETAAEQAEPTSLREQFLVGALYRRLERWDRAHQFLRRAAALPGASEQVLFELAVSQQESGRARAATGTLERLLKLDPDSPVYLNFYGYLLADQGWELDRAREMIDRAIEAEPDNGAYVDSLGWVLYRQGELEAALDELIRAVNLVGDDPIVLEHLGDCLRDLGQVDEARRTYRRALKLDSAKKERLQERIDGLGKKK